MFTLEAAAVGARWTRGLARTVRRLDPLTALPMTRQEPVAALDALAPSLMPRTAAVQGVVVGVSVLATRATGAGIDSVTRALLPPAAPLPARLAVRCALAGVGAAMVALPERLGQGFWPASVRSSGQLIRDAAAAGAVHDLGRLSAPPGSARRGVQVVAVVGTGLAALAHRAARRMSAPPTGGSSPAGLGAIANVRQPPRVGALAGTLVTASAVTAAGTVLVRVYAWSRGAIESYLGPGRSKRSLARVLTGMLWAAGGSTGYHLGVAYVGRANEKLAPAYAHRPESPLLSGSPDSLLPFDDLGWEGRRYVTDVVTPEQIEQVMGETAVAHPIRAYVGFNSEPRYGTGRAELALAELERTGAFDRSVLLLVSPTGTGWVDTTMVDAAELLARGDIATCCIQYARYPSFLSLQKVALGRAQFRLLLWGVKLRLAALPAHRRPRVLVFGESLGAWTSSDVIMYQGVDGFEHYGIDRALWVGMPWLAKWSRSGMVRGSSTLVPPGTVGVFDRHEQLAALDSCQLDELRAIVLSHDDDPIAVVGPDLLMQRPAWLAEGHRGRGVPDSMQWRPLLTFVQTAMDAMHVLVSEPGAFGSSGHDYRADMARFVRAAYGFPVATDAQLERIEEVLRSLELERAEPVRARRVPAAARGERHPSETERARGGVPLRRPRTRGARWVRRRGSIAIADTAAPKAAAKTVG